MIATILHVFTGNCRNPEQALSNTQEFRRRYNLVPLVKQDVQDDITNARTRATVRHNMAQRKHFSPCWRT